MIQKLFTETMYFYTGEQTKRTLKEETHDPKEYFMTIIIMNKLVDYYL